MSFVVSFGVLTGLFLIITALERVPRLQHTPARLRRPWISTDLAWYLVAAVAAGLSTFLLRPVLSKLALPGISDLVGRLTPGWSLLVAVIVFDAVFFTVHALLHRSETLWNVHKVHHSTRHLDVWATTRTHAFEHLVRNVPAQLVLFALGFEAATIASAVLVIAGFGALNHSNLRLPLRRLECLFATPRLHRLHHVPSTSLNNYATVLTIWDRAACTRARHDNPAATPLGVPGQATAEASEPPVERWARELFDETLLRLATARLEHDRLLYNSGALPDLARARIVLEDVRREMDVARRWVGPYLDA